MALGPARTPGGGCGHYCEPLATRSSRWAERTGPAAPGRPGPKGALGNGADGPPAARHLRPTAAADEPGGPTGVPRLCAVHSRQGRPRAARVRPARPIGAGMAIRGARGRAQRPRDRARGTRRRAGSARAAWLAASLARSLCGARSARSSWWSVRTAPRHGSRRAIHHSTVSPGV
jgi:hypothetical protein